MIEADGLDRLIADLGTAGIRAGLKAVPVTEEAGGNVRDLARSLAPRTGLPHYAKTITDEVTIEKASVTSEVGPEKGGQGSLGHILENGTASSPPHAHLGPALDLTLPGYIKNLRDVVNPFT